MTFLIIFGVLFTKHFDDADESATADINVLRHLLARRRTTSKTTDDFFHFKNFFPFFLELFKINFCLDIKYVSSNR